MMASSKSSTPKINCDRLRRHAVGCLRDRDGTTALEFAIVALPFFLFVFAIMGSSLYFFHVGALENAVEAAARKVRTGETVQNSTSIGDFRQSVCKEASTAIDCNKTRILIQSDSNWAGITPQNCLDGNNQMVNSTGSVEEFVSDYSGDARSVVLITVCYEWALANTFDFLMLGRGPGGSGSAVMQASTAFRIEPHPYD